MYISTVTSLQINYVSFPCSVKVISSCNQSLQHTKLTTTPSWLLFIYFIFAASVDNLDLQEVISKGSLDFDELILLISEIEKLYPVSLIPITEHGN